MMRIFVENSIFSIGNSLSSLYRTDNMSKYWVDLHLEEDRMQHQTISSLTVYLKKVANEIRVAHRYAPAVDEPETTDMIDLEKQLDWTRWALKEDIREYRLIPCFPDRPVVIKPEFPFRVSQGAQARIYTRVPVFVRVVPKDYPDFVITEIPTVVLSNTWFGTFMDGELCYGLPTTARREIADEMFEPHMAVCTIQIYNNTEGELNFDNICLRVDRLSMYIKDDYLWADQTDILYLGEEKLCDIEMKGRLPEEAKRGKLITRARTPIRKNFAVRTFQRLREIQPLGLMH